MPKNILVLSTSPVDRGIPINWPMPLSEARRMPDTEQKKLHCVKKILPSAKAAWPVKRQGAAS